MSAGNQIGAQTRTSDLACRCRPLVGASGLAVCPVTPGPLCYHACPLGLSTSVPARHALMCSRQRHPAVIRSLPLVAEEARLPEQAIDCNQVVIGPPDEDVAQCQVRLGVTDVLARVAGPEPVELRGLVAGADPLDQL